MKKTSKKRIALFMAVIMLFTSVLFMQGKAQEGDLPMLSGVFIATQLCADNTQPNRSWGQAEWNTAADQMTAVGIDTFVIQYAVQYWSETSKTFYYPATFETPTNAGQENQINQYEYILKAAKEHGMKVYLGLHIAEDYWFSAMDRGFPDTQFLTDSVALSSKVFDDLWKLYKGEYAQTIAGWYLPFEYNNAVSGEAKDRLVDLFYAPITKHIKSVTPDKKIMISPLVYTDLKQEADPAKLNTWYELTRDVLAKSRVDIIATQDGCGWESSVAGNLGPWYEKLAQAQKDAQPDRDKKGYGPGLIWNNPECYSMTGAGMNMRRLLGNMAAVQPYVGEHISFSIHSLAHMEGVNNAAMENKFFYDAYQYAYENHTYFEPSSAIPAPADITAEIAGGFNVQLKWTYMELRDGYMPIASYVVKRKLAGEDDGKAVKIAEVPQTYVQSAQIAYTDSMVDSGQGYEYLIWAVDGTGNQSSQPGRIAVDCPAVGLEFDRRYNNESFAQGLPVEFSNPVNVQYNDGSTELLTDGVKGTLISNWEQQRAQWFGVQKQEDKDIAKYSLTVSRIGKKDVGCAYLNFLYQPQLGIYLPEKVDIYVNNEAVPVKTVYPQKQYQNSLRGDVFIPVAFERVSNCDSITIKVTQKQEWSFLSEIRLYEAANTPSAGDNYQPPRNIMENQPVAITGIGSLDGFDQKSHLRGVEGTEVTESGQVADVQLFNKGLFATKNLTRDVKAPYVQWYEDESTYTRWLGVGNVGTSFQLTMDLSEPSRINNISLSFLQERNAGIYLPKYVEFYGDTGNGKLALLGKADLPPVRQLDFNQPLSAENTHFVEEKSYKFHGTDETLYRKIVLKVFPQYPGNFSYMKDLIVN